MKNEKTNNATADATATTATPNVKTDAQIAADKLKNDNEKFAAVLQLSLKSLRNIARKSFATTKTISQSDFAENVNKYVREKYNLKTDNFDCATKLIPVLKREKLFTIDAAAKTYTATFNSENF